MTDTAKACEALQYKLIHDDGYRLGWRANIAMAIFDTKQKKGETAHEWRNRCGEQFIKYFCAGHKDDPTSKLMESIGR